MSLDSAWNVAMLTLKPDLADQLAERATFCGRLLNSQIVRYLLKDPCLVPTFDKFGGY